MFTLLTFYMFAILIVISSLGVVLSKNPIYSLLLLIFVFFNTAGIFILLKAEFLASILIIVYVGAVAILFLFVIMLINVQNIDKKFYLTKSKTIAIFLILLIAVELLLLTKSGISSLKSISPDLKSNNIMSISKFGLLFFDNYYYIFIVCSLILTIAMIGAVILSFKDKEKINQRQDVYYQNNRDKENSVYKIDIEKEKGI